MSLSIRLSRSQEELSATLSSGISVNHVVTVFYSLQFGFRPDRSEAGVVVRAERGEGGTM